MLLHELTVEILTDGILLFAVEVRVLFFVVFHDLFIVLEVDVYHVLQVWLSDLFPEPFELLDRVMLDIGKGHIGPSEFVKHL